jgi:hypothetical protein
LKTYRNGAIYPAPRSRVIEGTTEQALYEAINAAYRMHGGLGETEIVMNRGRKRRAWDRARAKLKKQFFEKGITYCEQCGDHFNLSFAHRLKRRFITTDTELMTVALLCIPCHQKIEVNPDMFQIITNIIHNRQTEEI